MSKKKTDPRLDGLLGTTVEIFCPLFTHIEGLWVCGKREMVFSTCSTELHDSDEVEICIHQVSWSINHLEEMIPLWRVHRCAGNSHQQARNPLWVKRQDSGGGVARGRE